LPNQALPASIDKRTPTAGAEALNIVQALSGDDMSVGGAFAFKGGGDEKERVRERILERLKCPTSLDDRNIVSQGAGQLQGLSRL
jgi:hypothetical protein